jgi:hypothetical protein
MARLLARCHAHIKVRNLAVEDLRRMPKNSLVKYQCRTDDVVWYEPLEQVLAGAPLEPEEPSEAHWCPYCDDPVWPIGFLVLTEEDT